MDLREETTLCFTSGIYFGTSVKQRACRFRTRNSKESEMGGQVRSSLIGLMLISGGLRNCRSSVGPQAFKTSQVRVLQPWVPPEASLT